MATAWVSRAQHYQSRVIGLGFLVFGFLASAIEKGMIFLLLAPHHLCLWLSFQLMRWRGCFLLKTTLHLKKIMHSITIQFQASVSKVSE
jgi:hypothetical protein